MRARVYARVSTGSSTTSTSIKRLEGRLTVSQFQQMLTDASQRL